MTMNLGTMFSRLRSRSAAQPATWLLPARLRPAEASR